MSPNATYQTGGIRAPIEALCSQVHDRASRMSTEQLDGLMHAINYGDTWCGNYLMSLPPELHERLDLASIETGLGRLYRERTGHGWTSWSERNAIPPWERHWPKNSYMASWYAQRGSCIAGSQDALRIAAHCAQGSGRVAVSAAAALEAAAKREKVLRNPLLDGFESLCVARVKEEVVDLAKADIRRRARKLLEAGHSPRSVQLFVYWQAMVCIAAVIADAYHRVHSGPRK